MLITEYVNFSKGEEGVEGLCNIIGLNGALLVVKNSTVMSRYRNHDRKIIHRPCCEQLHVELLFYLTELLSCV